MFFSGVLTAVSIVAIAAKFSPTFLKRVLGYEWVVDIIMHGGIAIMFGLTGTISGIMTGIYTGLAVSAILFVTKRLWKYQKLEKNEEGKRVWVEYEGEWNARYFGAQIRKLKEGKIERVINEFKTGYAGQLEAA